MLSLGAFGFLQPWFLAGLAAVPLLWWLLRATPPRPRKVAFPGIRILLGLTDRERVPARTPWWLLLLRCIAAALALLAFSEPLLNPKARVVSSDPLLVVFDGGWTSAADWSARRTEALDAIARAGEADRPAAVISLAGAGPAPEAILFGPADEQAEIVRAMEPAPWRPDPTRLDAALADAGDAAFDTLWLTDSLAARAAASSDGAGADARAALIDALGARGAVTMLTPVSDQLALETPQVVEGALSVTVRRPLGGLLPEQTVRVAAYGRPGGPGDEGAGEESPAGAASDRAAFDPDAVGSAAERRLAVSEVVFTPGATRVEALIDLPLELRNAVTRLAIVGGGSAGAVSLLDASHRRRAVALVQGDETRSGQPLLSDLHFLRAALAPHAAAREMDLRSALGLPKDRDGAGFRAAGRLGAPADDGVAAEKRVAWADVIVLSDIGRVDEETAIALTDWVQSGGLLMRFAGPRLAALANDRTGPRVRALDDRSSESEILLPTPLRGGGRALGGALSWSTPQQLRSFPENSPFAGLAITEEVTVNRQVLAEPGPDLAKHVWAALSDGTPLVTARDVGKGRVVLFHVTASAAWSNLPLSGLFVDMIGRVVSAAPGVAGGEAALAEAARSWRPAVTLDGFGQAAPAPARADPVSGARLAEAVRLGATASAPPAVYVAETDEGSAALALNAFGAEESFMRADPPPAFVTTRPLSEIEEVELKPALLLAVLALLAIDVLAALLVAGRLRRATAAAAALLVAGMLATQAPPSGAQAQTRERPAGDAAETGAAEPVERFDPAERLAATETILAYVETGDAAVDRMSAAGLWGLSAILNERTSIEPGEPAGVNLDRDEIAVYSLLYWPITDRQPTPSDAAIRRLNAFLSTGGLLVVDTRDAHQAFGGGQGPMAPHLRRLIGALDLPALEPLPRDHVLTRTYYLLDDAPGRWSGGAVWVETGGSADIFDPEFGVEASENDGVSPVVIGGADWAAAWAVTPEGSYLAPMGRGGEAQRETAFRFGVNLVMYAFTGNYKSDQVHIPVLLERLGN